MGFNAILSYDFWQYVLQKIEISGNFSVVVHVVYKTREPGNEATSALATNSYLLCDNNVQVNVSMNEVTILVPADSAFNAH